MRSVVAAPVLPLAGFFLPGCGDTDLQSCWVGAQATIDGRSSDWNNLSTQYLKKYEATLSLQNDSTNLYLLFRFNDQLLARKIRMFGVTFWLSQGFKRKEYGVRYAGSVDMTLGHRADLSPEDDFALQRLQSMPRGQRRAQAPGTITWIRFGEEKTLP